MPERRITEADLDRHDALREKATPGPWILTDGVRERRSVIGPEPFMVAAGTPSQFLTDWVVVKQTRPDDAAYITTIANDDPYMCAEVRRLLALLTDAAVFIRIGVEESGWFDHDVLARLSAALAQPDAAEGEA